MRGIFWPTDRLSASQEGICPTELGYYNFSCTIGVHCSFVGDSYCSGVLIMEVRPTSHWTAAAFTDLLFVPGWEWMSEWVNEWINEWMSERTIFFLIFGNVEPLVEWYWHGKTEGLGEKAVSVRLCPPQIPLDWPGREPWPRSLLLKCDWHFKYKMALHHHVKIFQIGFIGRNGINILCQVGLFPFTMRHFNNNDTVWVDFHVQ
jgi:hypothetical protein